MLLRRRAGNDLDNFFRDRRLTNAVHIKVKESINSPAFFEAESIAVIREPCSDATDSSIPR